MSPAVVPPPLTAVSASLWGPKDHRLAAPADGLPEGQVELRLDVRARGTPAAHAAHAHAHAPEHGAEHLGAQAATEGKEREKGHHEWKRPNNGHRKSQQLRSPWCYSWHTNRGSRAGETFRAVSSKP